MLKYITDRPNLVPFVGLVALAELLAIYYS